MANTLVCIVPVSRHCTHLTNEIERGNSALKRCGVTSEHEVVKIETYLRRLTWIYRYRLGEDNDENDPSLFSTVKNPMKRMFHCVRKVE